jgi:predicted NBD/HSP70 family sugar kinase
VAEGPEVVLDWLERSFDQLLAEVGRGREALRGIGVGLPGPVEFATGRPVSPPIMPGWNLHPVGERLSDRFGVPALVDNDVNIMAVGERWTHWRDEAFMMFVKIGTGIGCGVVASGYVHRGANGAAGDIGHIHVPDHDEVVCRCGNVGCLEAIAGGGAVAARLGELGLDTRTARDVVEQVLAGQPEAVRLVRQAGHTIGGVLAACVNMVNPAVIVVGGDMALAGELLLAGIREVVYKRSLPLATGGLRIVPSQLGDEAGITGAAVMVLETILAPAAIDAALVGDGQPF